MFIVTGFMFSPDGDAYRRLRSGQESVHVVRDMYTGIVTRDGGDQESGAQCRYGIGRIIDWRSGPNSISFSIRFPNEGGVINLRFNDKYGNEWLGVYESQKFGKGIATCFMCESSEHLLSSEFVARRLQHY